MILDQKDVEQLREMLILQLAKLVDEDGTFTTLEEIIGVFRYDDGLEDGEHTPKHGLGLSIKKLEYLVEEQGRHIFVRPKHEDSKDQYLREHSYWSVNKEQLDLLRQKLVGKKDE